MVVDKPTDTSADKFRRREKGIHCDGKAGGGTESTYTRIKQLIKTAKANTNLPVYLYINGRQADVIGGEGIMLKQPLSERSLDD